MNTSYKPFAEITSLILNILLILGSLSVILYLLGLFNLLFFYNTLGVNALFLDLQYNNVLFNGLIENLLLVMFFLPYLISFYVDLYQLRKIRALVAQIEELTKNHKKIPKSDKNEILSYVKPLYGKIEKAESTLTENSVIKVKVLRRYFYLSIFSFLLAIVFYFFNAPKLYFSFISSGIAFIVILSSIYILHTMVKEKLSYSIFPQIISAFLLILIALNGLNGYLEAQAKLKSNNFDIYTINLNKGLPIHDARFVYFGNDKYFFNVNNKLEIIPNANINYLFKN